MLILARIGQYLGASGLFGGALLLARQQCGLPRSGGPSLNERRLLMASVLMLSLSTVAALVLQAAAMAGDDPLPDLPMLGMVLASTSFGHAVMVRLAVTLAAIPLLLGLPTYRRLRAMTVLGAVSMLTLAWGGHGVSDTGWAGLLHLGADSVHLLAAGLWIGALSILVVMAMETSSAGGVTTWRLERALSGFSGAGTIAVALLILTGLVNGWFLVGPRHLASLVTTLYGRLLLAKLALFAAMLGLAAIHRWRLTPRLASAAAGSGGHGIVVTEIRRSIALETAFAVLVLSLVGWLGTLAPPAGD
jgi:putative copper resistance protein D